MTQQLQWTKAGYEDGKQGHTRKRVGFRQHADYAKGFRAGSKVRTGKAKPVVFYGFERAEPTCGVCRWSYVVERVVRVCAVDGVQIDRETKSEQALSVCQCVYRALGMVA